MLLFFQDFFHGQKYPIYFDKQILRRVHNIQNFLRDGRTLPALIKNYRSEMALRGTKNSGAFPDRKAPEAEFTAYS